jgi:hypothetical protein
MTFAPENGVLSTSDVFLPCPELAFCIYGELESLPSQKTSVLCCVQPWIVEARLENDLFKSDVVGQSHLVNNTEP